MKRARTRARVWDRGERQLHLRQPAVHRLFELDGQLCRNVAQQRIQVVRDRQNGGR